MICALARPIGGWCGDRIGGGITTLVCNLLMAIGTLGILTSLPGDHDGGSFSLFLIAFQLIFFAAGVGNGSSYQLSPKVFLIEAGRQAKLSGESVADAYTRGGRRGVAAMSISSVSATLGGFFIPKAFGNALDWFSSFVPAFMLFLAFYLVSMAVAWWQYARPTASMRC
jgi:NNP family nitrate/nitrite transporter-like MFS transporter